MGIRKELHPKLVDGKNILPLACYTLSNVEQRALCHWLQNIKVPDGYSAKFSRCVNIGE